MQDHNQTLPSLGWFLHTWRSAGTDAFLEQYTCPFLIVTPPSEGEASPWQPTGTNKKLMLVWSSEQWSADPEHDLVLPIQKRPGANMFKMMVTLGRAPNNDLCLPYRSISKFHAFFTQSGDWMLQDESRNGTIIDQVPLKPRGRRILQGNEVIHLSEVTCRFVTLQAMFDLIEQPPDR